MASWVKCTDLKAQTVWVNLDNVTVMCWRDTPQDTEIIFIGGGQVIVRETRKFVVQSGSCSQCGHLLPNSFRARYNRAAIGCSVAIVVVIFMFVLIILTSDR